MPKPASKAARYLAATGDEGRQLLDDAGPALKARLVDMDPGVARLIARGRGSGRLTTATIRGYTDTVAAVPSRFEGRIRDVVRETGPSGVRLFSRLDADGARRVVPDGGPIIADDLARAIDDVDVDQQWLRDKLGDLGENGQSRAADLINGKKEQAVRLIDDIEDAAARKALFQLDESEDFGSFDRWDDWRESFADANLRIDSTEFEDYINHVREAGELDNVNNPAGLVAEFANNPKQFQGQSGEAASAVRYADDGADVTGEPGNGEFDLAVTDQDGTKFVEVRTTRTSPDQIKVDDHIRAVNGKFKRARSNPDVDISSDDPVLEIRLRDLSVDQDSVVQSARKAITQRQNQGLPINMDEIRIIQGDSVVEVPISP